MKFPPYIYLPICLLLLLSACNKRLSPGQYMSHLNNDRSVVDTFNSSIFHLEMIFRPFEFMVLNEIGPDHASESTFDQMEPHYKPYSHFVMRVFSDDKKNDPLGYKNKTGEEYFTRIQYLTGPFKEDIRLVQNNDTFPCIDHIYVRGFNLRPFEQMVCVFDHEFDRGESAQLLYNGLLSDFKPVQFNFKSQSIKNIPILKI